MATYDFQQQIYSLSQTANVSFDKRFPSLEELQDYVTNTVEKLLAEPEVIDLIGNWKTIWGPYTYCHYADKGKHLDKDKKNPYYSDNTMFLAYDESANHYVLSVAGTNAISWYGWLVEDFNTIITKKWTELVPETSSPDARISQGTYIGVNILLDKITEQYAGNPPGIVAALKAQMGQAKPGATLAVTGHSLGGALSPTLALYLKETQHTWDPSGKVTLLSTYPTAGPTPGDKKFAQLMESQMGVNYHSAYNKIDMVPHAWEVDMLKMIPGLFIPCGINKPRLVSDVVDTLIVLTGLNNYQQAQPMTVLQGSCYATSAQLIENIIGEISPEMLEKLKAHGLGKLEDLVAFFMEAAYQHTTAYDTLLNREAFAKLFLKAIGAKPDYKRMVLVAIDELLRIIDKSKIKA